MRVQIRRHWAAVPLAMLVAALLAPTGANAAQRVSEQTVLGGKVTNQDAEALAGVAVTATGPSGSTFSATTDEQGEFSIDIPAGGEWGLRLAKEGYGTFEAPVLVTDGEHLTVMIEIIEAGTKPGSESAEPYAAGLAAYNRGDLATAIAKLEEAVELDPERVEAYLALAQACFETKDYRRAGAAADRVLELRPKKVHALNLRYEAYRALGEKDREAAALAALVELDPGPVTARRLMSASVERLEAGELEAAAELLEQAVSMDSELAPAYSVLAQIYFNLGRYGEAVARGERAVELDPGKAEIWGVLYLAHRIEGRPDQADAAFEGMRAADLGYVGGAFFEHGRQLFNSTNVLEAQEIFEKVVGMLPEHPQANYMLARCLIQTGDTVRAKGLLKRFLELAPNDPEAATAREMLAAM